MAKLPFADPDPPRQRDEAQAPWSVSQAAVAIKSAVARGIPRKVRIVGEVSNFADRNHWFFSLKEGKAATLRCVCFASSARRVRCRVADGMEVIATGRIDFFDAQGQVQLYVDQIEPVGQGTLEIELRRLLEELREAGYFEPAHKQRLPAVPRRVAVVTSRSAAALQDVIQTARKRFPGVRLYLCDVRVQGAASGPEVAQAIRALSRDGARLGIEAVIVTRGGGSIEDLWAFNEREVAEAIYACPLPVVAAIGHETDTTVAELVADARCSTPTQAAVAVVPDRQTLSHQVDQLGGRLSLLMRRQVERQRHRVDSAARHALFREPRRLVQQADQRLSRLAQTLDRAIARRGREARRRLEADERHLGAVGPRSVLGRGYTYTLDAQGAVLRSSAQAKAGQRITTVLHDGQVTSRVEGEGGHKPGGASPHAASTPPPGPAPKKKRQPRVKKPSDLSGPGLFG